ncbi:MAG TPA: ATP-binding cassette domain-containing protein [Vicinamibacterales bacterium]|nr:ATP-binding cassette domain-containing protein [Vicinamibacterales bacterium]
MTAPFALDVRGLVLRRGSAKASAERREILRDVSFTADRGDIVVITGPSGSGKTTILRAIAGLDVPDAGRIAVEGGRAGMVFQFHCLFEHLSALDNVCLAPVHAHGVSRADAVRRAHELLAAFGVDHRASALPRELSGGEAQRVAIARALAVDPHVLLLDEPTASLDANRRAELGALLVGLARQGRTLVIATHDEDFTRAFASRTYRLADGMLR